MFVDGKYIELEGGGIVEAKKVCEAFGGLLVDEGYVNTAYCESRVTYVDGERGVCLYRGYRIEELAENSDFLEVAYLLLHGELPSENIYRVWSDNVMRHSFVHENLLTYLKSFRYDAHPMGMFVAAMAALSTFHAEANPVVARRDLYDGNGEDARRARNTQVFRILGSLPTILACIYRHRVGRPYNYPDASCSLSYSENLLFMMDRMSESNYRPNPVLAKALDILFIIHADHELNCSTAAMRHLASTRVDPFTAVAGAASALYGPLHGGANEAVLRMLEEVGTVDKIDELLEGVKNKTRRLMGFGHRIYKNYDPRARILKAYAEKVFAIVGRDPLADVAFELERRALADDYFVSRKLYPNVDFYSGLIYRAMGFPTEFFPLLFALPRAAGWLAHWWEALDSDTSALGSTHLTRPLQVSIDFERKSYIPVKQRDDDNAAEDADGVSRTRKDSDQSQRRPVPGD